MSWLNVLEEVSKVKSMGPRIIYNSECLQCEAIFKEMIRIGALVFCTSCYCELFKTEYPIEEEREKYLAWLEKYKLKYGG